MSEMVKYRAALWSFLNLTALVFYRLWHSPLESLWYKLRFNFLRNAAVFRIITYDNFWKKPVKSRFFKNRELYWSNLAQNQNLWRESFVQKSGVQIPVGEGQIFCHFSFFLYLFHFVHKKLNIKKCTTVHPNEIVPRRGPPSVDYEESDRKVNHSLVHSTDYGHTKAKF